MNQLTDQEENEPMYADVSLDVGNKASKGATRGRIVAIRNLAVRADGSEDALKKLDLSLGGNGQARGDEDQGESAHLWINGEQWVIGEEAWHVNIHTKEKTGFNRYGTPEWQAMWLGTLATLLGGRSAMVGLSCSMPVTQLDRRSEMIDYLVGDGVWEVAYEDREARYEIVPELVEVVPEGFGILAYLCLDEAGRKLVDRELPQSNVVVFDLGGYTLDIGTFRKWTVGDYYKSFRTGLVDIRNRVNDELKARFNRSSEVPGRLLDEAIATGRFSHKNDEYDVSDIVRRSTDDLIGQILSIWEEQLGSGADFKHVIIGGGGGPAIGPLLEPQFDHRGTRILPNGEAHIANAVGVWRYRRFRENARRAAESAR